jgi:hypothetical protein
LSGSSIVSALYLDAQPVLAARDILLRQIHSPEAASQLPPEQPDVVVVGDRYLELAGSALGRLSPEQVIRATDFRDATGLINRLSAFFPATVQQAATQIELDPGQATILLNGTRIRLTPREFDILNHLYSAPSHSVTRKEFFRKIWGGLKVCNKVLDVHVSNLRKKIQAHGLRIQFTKPDSFTMTLPPAPADADDPAPAGDGPDMLLMAATGV